MRNADCFSQDYVEARGRFRAAARYAGCELEAIEIGGLGPDGAALTLDAALRRGAGAAQGRALVISSGLIGVSGLFGSAVQLTLLEDEAWLERASDRSVLFLHALNPYGFAHRRRCNERNVDLSESFIVAGAARPEPPNLYHDLAPWLNPPAPPSQDDPFPAELAVLISILGLPKLMNTLPLGQYAYPRGLFYGGREPSETQRALAKHMPRWLKGADEVLHIDFETGRGDWEQCRLAAGTCLAPEAWADLAARFGAEKVAPSHAEADEAGMCCGACGQMNDWISSVLPEARCRVLTAEFGTYSPEKILTALRAENCAHHWGGDQEAYAWTKEALLEAFVPADRLWRTSCLTKAAELCETAIA